MFEDCRFPALIHRKDHFYLGKDQIEEKIKKKKNEVDQLLYLTCTCFLCSRAEKVIGQIEVRSIKTTTNCLVLME